MDTSSSAITVYHTTAGSFVVGNGVWIPYEEWLRDPRLVPGWIYANP